MEEQIVRAIDLGFKADYYIISNTVELIYDDEKFFFNNIRSLKNFLDFAETLEEIK